MSEERSFLVPRHRLGVSTSAMLLLVAALGANPMYAQGLYGSLLGNVTDPTTASVPGAKVKITHVQTDRVRETQSNTDGSYTFPTIPPGTYELEISPEGFQTFTQRNIPATINTSVRVDASLAIGAATESMEVTGQTALLQTEGAEVRSEFTTKSLSNLPLPPGRNYEQLYVTIPGFTPPANWGPIPTNPSRVTTSTVNGASHTAVSLTIDGASSRSVWMRAIAAIAPALEAIETVNVATNSMDTEQGFAGSASISLNYQERHEQRARDPVRVPHQQQSDSPRVLPPRKPEEAQVHSEPVWGHDRAGQSNGTDCSTS